MYFCNVNSKFSSCPSINCQTIKERSLRNLTTIHPTFPETEYDSITHTERFIVERSDENGPRPMRDLTQLKSPSSEELEALLKGKSASSFTGYWQHQLFEKAVQNYNMYSAKHGTKGCHCKPNYINKDDSVIFENRIERRIVSCPNQPRNPATEISQTDGGTKEVSQGVSSKDNTLRNSEKIKVCLPLDLEKLMSKDSSGKTIKLIIYGDKTQCDYKSSNSEKSEDKSSSNECLACTLAKNLQIKNVHSGGSGGKIDKKDKQRKGFPSKISGALSTKLSFFRKKQKPSIPSYCSEKFAQTCEILKLDTMVGSSPKVDKASSCVCFTKNEQKANTERTQPVVSKTNSCECSKCGKIDMEKLFITSPERYRNDCLKWVLKMEAKQNYRQIKCILKELQDQRQEIKELHKRYTSLMQLRINESSKDKMEKHRQDMRKQEEKTSDETEWIKSKDLKNAMNQSTLSEQINCLQETKSTSFNSIEKTASQPSSPLSLFDEVPVRQAPKDNAINDEKSDSIAERDSCSCDETLSYKQQFKNFWRNCWRKKEIYTEECECTSPSVSKPIEKCKSYLLRKLVSKP